MKNKLTTETIRQNIPDNSTLLDYLQNSLTKSQKRELEEWITDDRMVGDAVEGLQLMKNFNEINEIDRSLSLMIDKKVSKKKRKILQPIRFPLWMTLLITTTLLAILVGYILIRMLNN
jgi:hypothetical protein